MVGRTSESKSIAGANDDIVSSSFQPVVDVVSDIMETTLSSTSRVIAGWIRDTESSRADNSNSNENCSKKNDSTSATSEPTSRSSTYDPFYWMSDYLAPPSLMSGPTPSASVPTAAFEPCLLQENEQCDDEKKIQTTTPNALSLSTPSSSSSLSRMTECDASVDLPLDENIDHINHINHYEQSTNENQEKTLLEEYIGADACCAYYYPMLASSTSTFSPCDDYNTHQSQDNNNKASTTSVSALLDQKQHDHLMMALPISDNTQPIHYVFNEMHDIASPVKGPSPISPTNNSFYHHRRGSSFLGDGSVFSGDDCSVRTDLQSIHSFLMVSYPHTKLLQQQQQQQQFQSSQTNPGLLRQFRSQSSIYSIDGTTMNTQQHQQLLESQFPAGTLDQISNTAMSSLPLANPPSNSNEAVVTNIANDDYILTPSLMQQLQHYFPMMKKGDSFWLQYSLVRDGASLPIMYEKVATIQHSVLAIETINGEIFGAFLPHTWGQIKGSQWYGGYESFVWTTIVTKTVTKKTTKTLNVDHLGSNKFIDDDIAIGLIIDPTKSSGSMSNLVDIADEKDMIEDEEYDAKDISFSTTAAVIIHDDAPDKEAEYDEQQESKNEEESDDEDIHVPEEIQRELQVYKYSFSNPYIQLCDVDRLWIGGGNVNEVDPHQGFAIALDQDLMTGNSNPCRTFSSPCLSQLHVDGSSFEIRNVEVWDLTPCLSMVEASGRRVVHRESKGRRKR